MTTEKVRTEHIQPCGVSTRKHAQTTSPPDCTHHARHTAVERADTICAHAAAQILDQNRRQRPALLTKALSSTTAHLKLRLAGRAPCSRAAVKGPPVVRDARYTDRSRRCPTPPSEVRHPSYDIT